MNANTIKLPFLLQIIDDLEDPRDIRGRIYPLNTLIFIALCSTLCGGDSFNDMEEFAETRGEWVKSYVPLPAYPTHDTFNRLFQVLSIDGISTLLHQLNTALQQETPTKTIAFDGKTIRGSVKGGKAIHILNAWGHESRLALGQLTVDDKSNEITALPALIDTLDIKGALITVDALNTQKKVAEKVIEKKGDYLFLLKQNHPIAQNAVSYVMKDIVASREADFEQIEKDHGRIEIRRCWQTDDLRCFADRHDWIGLKTLARIDRKRIFPYGKETEETILYLSSLPIDPKRLAEAARGHWGIENQFHWCLDVIFNEDQCRARTRNAACILSTLRAFTLNILRQNTKKCSLRLKRYKAALSVAYLEELLRL